MVMGTQISLGFNDVTHLKSKNRILAIEKNQMLNYSDEKKNY